MGIKNLNQYLLTMSSNKSIKKIHFETLSRKIIVIDISIYLYKFMSDGNFMENLYTLLSIFKYYIITPIFIFDGKPPPEKWELLKKRRWEKKDAETRMLTIQSDISNNIFTKEELDEMEREMEELRKKAVRLKSEDIKQSKELLDAFGMIYYDAPGEADQLCCYFVNMGIAWACLSDDMDMFLYGCTRVLRNLSLMNHRVLIYDTPEILTDLGLTYNDFLEIAVLCGTDYNTGYVSLRKTLELHNEYKAEDRVVLDTKKTNFYDWFIKRSKLNETDNFQTICNMFDLSNQTNVLDKFINCFKTDVLEKRMSISKIKEIMVNYGFLFP
jgi:5'-3' exonuclease